MKHGVINVEAWLVYAMLGALFAGINAILKKVGVKEVNSNLATAVRTVIIVIFSWIVVFSFGSQTGLFDVSGRTWIFLIASGLSTGASWLCYLYALKFGTVSNVTPLKKSSTVLTIILAFLILREPFGFPQMAGILFITAGTIFMLKKKDGSKGKDEGGGNWLLFAALAAFFASLRTIFGAIGIADVDANLGNAIRVVVVLIASWAIVFYAGKQNEIKNISKKGLLFLILSGLATGANWLFFFRALQTGPVSAIAAIDKLSVILSILFAYILLKEKQSAKRVAGLACLIIGTLVLVMLGT